ncbi:MAG: esterase/lipase family protein [Paracoccaceae bacterium]
MTISRQALRLAAAIALPALLAACGGDPRPPDLGSIYARPEAGETPRRTPLISVPGTLGSRLVHGPSGTVVWGGEAWLSVDPDDPRGVRMIALPIPGDDAPVAGLADDVAAEGVLEVATARVLGLPVGIDVYAGALDLLRLGGFARVLGTGADTPEARNSYRFAYDWRRDIPALARAFGRFVEEKAEAHAAWRSAVEGRAVAAEDIRFDLVAHSMGALVTRWWLMHGDAPLAREGALPPVTWAGAGRFRRVVFVAPPNAGSVLAFENLVNGKSFGPLQPRYAPALLATFPSNWQLMPRARHAPVRRGTADGLAVTDLYDPALWEARGWGLAGAPDEALATLMPDAPDPETRRVRARAHQARLLRRAERVHAALDRWGTPPERLRTYLVVGGGFETPARAVVEEPGGAVTVGAVAEGDGVVLRSSVLLDERVGRDAPNGPLDTPLRFDTTLLLPDEHVRLTRNRVFADNLLFWLLDEPGGGGPLRRPDETGPFGAGEPVVAREAPRPAPPDR